MPRLRRIRRGGWKHLLELANSPNKNDRAVAIIRAYAWIEDALDAARVPRGKSIAARIISSLNIPAVAKRLYREDINKMLKIRQQIHPAIQTRHRMAHRDEIPCVEECQNAVGTLMNVWHALGRDFVSWSTAIKLAENFLESIEIETVCLFGSLARGDHEPNDIDFLLLSNGGFVCEVDPEYEEGKVDTVLRTHEALKLMQITDCRIALAAKCRWLDIAIIDGTRFGIDKSYTAKLRDMQVDPWFFEHIAVDLLTFDPGIRGFAITRDGPFREIRDILLRLKEFGLR